MTNDPKRGGLSRVRLTDLLGGCRPEREGLSMKATHSPGLSTLFTNWTDEDDAAMQAAPQGAFDVATNSKGQRYFWFKCPGACASITTIALRPVVVDGNPPSWDWNGSTDAPTLTPSINHVGCWHGWLTDGNFTAC